MRHPVFVIASLCLASALVAADHISYVDLVNRLVDLQGLAIPPQPGESCRLFSSYDRKSHIDAASGRYVDWSANGDGTGLVRMEGDSAVLAEMKGPGVIWRIWSAAPRNGHVRIYLDGAAEAAVDLPFRQYFDASTAPFTRKSLCYLTKALGLNNFVPIPYQKSCKIVADKDWGMYYQFTYTTFPAETVVPTFTRELPVAAVAALDRVDAILQGRLGQDPASPRPGQEIEKKLVIVNPGQRNVVAELVGQRAITSLRVKLDPMPLPGDLDTLRELCLRITWDDERIPAVWAPLGDFFGSAPGFNRFRSFPLGMEAEGFYSLWYMPFSKQARIELVNDGKTARHAEFEITHAPWQGAADSTLRFHAKWHRDLPPLPEPERKIDWPLLRTDGAGRLVGVMLAVWNARGGWWGEGDEKFYVDGELFPSSFGTGSEDYFGYAWSKGDLFQQAYHGQTRNDSLDNVGHLSVHRWQIADNVPFHTSLQADIEKYLPNRRCQFAATVCWYQSVGTMDPYPVEAPLSERTDYYVPVFKIPGAIEAELMRISARTAGEIGNQEMDRLQSPTRQWSLGTQLRWLKVQPGDKMTLTLPVAAAGTYRLSARMTKAKDAGIVQFSLDGATIGKPIDLYNDEIVPTDPIALDTLRLSAGNHPLDLVITGANDKVVRPLVVGVDCFTLEAVP